ncbi:MAG: hypothetical protein J7621_22430 [Niastella sp.]|nr:hypothetical protein [Niastella sp.]
MQAASKRYIKSGRDYDYLFPAAMNKDKTVKENASLDDTIAFIHKVVGKTLPQTAGIARVLQAPTIYQTCRNIWHFVYENVAYKKDDDGLEQIRSPRRTWRDRKTGVDCDCYSTFISSILTNLRIPHQLRITKYKRDHFQHIYPVVPDGGRMITIDCVTDQFDYEVPYSEKKDITMDLQYLDGLHGAGLGDRGNDLVFEGYSMGALGAAKKKKKGFFKKVISKINRINPATILLRNGFLAAMKLNLFRVAQRIKYAYLTPEEATKRGILPDKYQKLVKAKDKMENIFETAGGKAKNLKKAILKGKGNKNNEVALQGLGFLASDASVLYMDQNTPLAQLLGPEIYYDENVGDMEGFEGFGELGEPATGAAVAAASAAVAAVAKILKAIGPIFSGGQKGSEDFAEGEAAAADKEIADTPAASNPPAAITPAAAETPVETNAVARVAPESSAAATPAEYAEPVEPVSDNTAIVPATAPITMNAAVPDSPAPSPLASKESFWQKNRKWLLPTVIGVGSIAVIAIGMKLMKPAHKPPAGSLQGTPKKKAAKPKSKKEKKKAVALL